MRYFVIVFRNVITHFNNNAVLFKFFILITHEHGKKLWCDKKSLPLYGDDLCLLLNHSSCEKKSTDHYFQDLL